MESASAKARRLHEQRKREDPEGFKRRGKKKPQPKSKSK